MTKATRRYQVFDALKRNPSSSIRELCQATGIRWPSHIHALLQELENEGLIRRKPYHMDTIEIVAEPAKTKPSTRKAKNRRAGNGDERMPMPRQSPARLEKMIERVVRKAKEREASADVMHEYRSFPRSGFRARRIG